MRAQSPKPGAPPGSIPPKPPIPPHDRSRVSLYFSSKVKKILCQPLAPQVVTTTAANPPPIDEAMLGGIETPPRNKTRQRSPGHRPEEIVRPPCVARLPLDHALFDRLH